MKVIVLQTAEEDLEHSWQFYENQEPGVGNAFYEEVISAVRALSQDYPLHPCQGRFHRSLVRKFHAGIYDSIETDQVVVHRILDLRRDPRWLRRQLQS